MTLDMRGFVESIHDATTVYRMGDVVDVRQVGNVEVVEVFGYPHVGESVSGETLVDLVFVTVGVKQTVKRDRDVWLEMLKKWESPTLKGGPSYIHAGAELGDQETALRLFAIMAVLGLASLMTPKTLGVQDPAEIREMAGMGFVYAMPTGDLKEALDG